MEAEADAPALLSLCPALCGDESSREERSRSRVEGSPMLRQSCLQHCLQAVEELGRCRGAAGLSGSGSPGGSEDALSFPDGLIGSFGQLLLLGEIRATGTENLPRLQLEPGEEGSQSKIRKVMAHSSASKSKVTFSTPVIEAYCESLASSAFTVVVA